MNHRQYTEWLQLSMYEELSEEEQRLLSQHLITCTECQAEQAELRKFHSVLAQYKPAEASDVLVQKARQQLRAAVQAERSKRTVWDRLGDSIRITIQPQYRLVFGAVALLAVGFFLGYLILVPSPVKEPGQVAQTESPVLQGNTRITNVRFINNDMENCEIEFMFEAVKPVRMKGSINDPQIQKVLTHALLTEQNPGVRLRSVSTIASLPSFRDKDVKEALITSLKTDENDGVRSEALKALKNYPMDESIKQALLSVLTHDKNPGIRIAAINYLDSAKVTGETFGEDVLSVLREKMQTDENNYIRLRAKAVVEEIKQ